MENNSLYHWGIKGMKWGVRRFQNKDGSLTPEGKKRYDDDGESNGKKKESDKPSTGRKSASEMTDDELRKAIDRARMEDTYNQLRPEKISGGKKFTDALIHKVIAPAATEAGRNLATKVLNNAVDSLTKGKVDLDSVDVMKKEIDKLETKLKLDQLKNTKAEDYKVSYEERLKRQQYEKNAKSEDYDTLDAKLKTEKKQKEYDDWTKSQNKSSTEKTNDDIPTYSGTVEGKGKSKFTGFENNSTVEDIWFEDTISNFRDSQAYARGAAYLLEDKSR